MRRSSWIELTLAVGLLLLTSGAHAQAEEADELVARGVELRQAGDDAAAAELFGRAFEASGSSRALAQLALAEQALGRWVLAREHLGQVMGMGGEWVERHRDTLTAALATIDEHVGRLDIQLDIAGATIRVNGRAVEALPVYVQVGPALVQVEAEGYRPAEREVEIEAGGLSRVHVPLVSARIAPTPEPEAIVETTAASEIERLAPAPDPASDDTSSPWITVGLATGGAALLTIVGGVVALVVRENAALAYNDPVQCPAWMSLSCQDEANTFHSAATWALGLGIAGAAMAAFALVAIIVGVTDDSPTNEQLAVAPGPGDVGVALELQW